MKNIDTRSLLGSSTGNADVAVAIQAVGRAVAQGWLSVQGIFWLSIVIKYEK